MPRLAHPMSHRLDRANMTAQTEQELNSIATATAAALRQLPDAERIARAEQRLAQSREALWLDVASDGTLRHRDGTARSGLGLLLRMARRSIRRWWQGHPVHLVTSGLGSELDARLKPLAQHRPVMLLGAALVAGALLTWLAPRRLVLGVLPWLVHEVHVLARTLLLTFFTRP